MKSPAFTFDNNNEENGAFKFSIPTPAEHNWFEAPIESTFATDDQHHEFQFSPPETI